MTVNEYSMTFLVTLETLDQSTAVFSMTESNVVVCLPRDKWQKIGRPTEFIFTPMDPKTYFDGRATTEEELLVDED